MSESVPETYAFRVNAELLVPGQKLVLDELTLAPLTELRIEEDDFGTPALVIADLEDGGTVRIAYGSAVRVAAPAPEQNASEAVRSVPTDEETYAAVLAAAQAAHPDDRTVKELITRLRRGLNVKAGSNLQDVRDLAYTLYVDLGDARNALAVCGLITGLGFDGNYGRWNWIQGALSLAAHITHETGDLDASNAYAQAVRAGDHAESDPLKAKLSAELLQRQLNEPNLYDREVQRAAEASDEQAERDWRVLRLNTLLYLRAHGGSEAYSDAELQRRIRNELSAIRGLNLDL
ncbi:hypothetical protein H9639_13410 [Arthrobacter sp. Sa2CUA1]|uniref:Tetratricopeptide repeat protein n=1 Tax=Arthrobacter gallicola TaxID=2762225 RepID=A0ABR8UUQ0_9MICC|nr:DUF6707 family protein [Arthrobacter gallicola]MBD7996296.1 hypothetical protein [Arthrobacter gallicola]